MRSCPGGAVSRLLTSIFETARWRNLSSSERTVAMSIFANDYFITTDGMHWAPLELDEADGFFVTDLIYDAGWWVAAGVQDDRPVMFVSRDGLHWARQGVEQEGMALVQWSVLDDAVYYSARDWSSHEQADAREMADGWKWSPAFGWFYATEHPWVWLLEGGWHYVVNGSLNAYWAWQMDDGWHWLATGE